MLRKLLLAVFVFSACTAMAHAGIYVGAGVGNAKVNASDNGLDFNDSDTAYKIYGGWTFMKFFAVEGSYVDLGSPEDSSGGTTAKISATGWDAYGVGKLPLGKHFEIFGKLGFILWDTDVDISGAGSSSDSGTDTAYGAGVAFHFGKHLSVRAEYERFDISDIDKLEVGSIGADFRF